MLHKTVDYSYLKRYQPSPAYKKLNQDKELLAHWPLARDLPQARGAGIIMSGDKKYLTWMIYSNDNALGANPMNLGWTVGLGTRMVRAPWHNNRYSSSRRSY